MGKCIACKHCKIIPVYSEYDEYIKMKCKKDRTPTVINKNCKEYEFNAELFVGENPK